MDTPSRPRSLWEWTAYVVYIVVIIRYVHYGLALNVLPPAVSELRPIDTWLAIGLTQYALTRSLARIIGQLHAFKLAFERALIAITSLLNLIADIADRMNSKNQN